MSLIQKESNRNKYIIHVLYLLQKDLKKIIKLVGPQVFCRFTKRPYKIVKLEELHMFCKIITVKLVESYMFVYLQCCLGILQSQSNLIMKNKNVW